MAFINNESVVIFAEELLKFDEIQLIEFMKGCIDSENKFNISKMVELLLMSKHQQIKLFEKLKWKDFCWCLYWFIFTLLLVSRIAARDVKITREFISIDIDTFLKRLIKIVDNSKFFLKNMYSLSSHVRFSIFAHISLCESEDIELICYEKFVQNGERSVISFEILSQTLTKLNFSCEKILSWLNDLDFKN